MTFGQSAYMCAHGVSHHHDSFDMTACTTTCELITRISDTLYKQTRDGAVSGGNPLTQSPPPHGGR